MTILVWRDIRLWLGYRYDEKICLDLPLPAGFSIRSACDFSEHVHQSYQTNVDLEEWRQGAIMAKYLARCWWFEDEDPVFTAQWVLGNVKPQAWLL